MLGLTLRIRLKFSGYCMEAVIESVVRPQIVLQHNLLHSEIEKTMKLNPHKPDIAVQAQRQNLDWSIKSYANPLQQFQADTWVQLLSFPAPSALTKHCYSVRSQSLKRGFPIMVKQC